MKGKVTIELKNTKTGESQKIEGDNMITNAIAEYLNNLHYMQYLGTGSQLQTNPCLAQLPIAEKLLGSLLIFSDSLVEDATKYTIPSNKKILGYAANDSDNETINRGSYNPNESGATLTGYKHVWDFSTSQCNGVISALSLTHREMGKEMVIPKIHYYFNSEYGIGNEPTLSFPAGITNPKVLILKNNYMYYAVISNGNINIYKISCKLSNFKVADYILGQTKTTSPSELIATIPYGTANYYGFTTDGKDYAYMVCPSNNAIYAQNLNVMKISLSDFSYTTKTITFEEAVECHAWVSIDGYVFAQKYNNSGNNTIYIYNLSTDEIITATLPENVNMNYFGITEYGLAYAYKSSTKAWLIYPDGTIFSLKSFTTSGSRPYLPCIAGTLITSLTTTNSSNAYLCFSNHYLGTIYNLQAPIVKTNQDVMKITYELIDA